MVLSMEAETLAISDKILIFLCFKKDPLYTAKFQDIKSYIERQIGREILKSHLSNIMNALRERHYIVSIKKKYQWSTITNQGRREVQSVLPNLLKKIKEYENLRDFLEAGRISTSKKTSYDNIGLSKARIENLIFEIVNDLDNGIDDELSILKGLDMPPTDDQIDEIFHNIILCTKESLKVNLKLRLA